jgi:mono/diheme cytochrome c family protein
MKYIVVLGSLLFVLSCGQPGVNSTGREYIPDMGHSVAIESNVYTFYERNTWDEESALYLKDLSNPHLPVKGTIPRGYAGVASISNPANRMHAENQIRGRNAINAIPITLNGHVPYYYEDTEEERNRAIKEIINNPYPITSEGLAKGKELYTVFCGVCHGEKGDGLGYLVREADPSKGDPGGVYPAAPANFLLDDLVNSSNGRYYHSIIYGKNVMGGYADKMSYEERWQVIHYIRSLQASDKKVAYDENENGLNPLFGTPITKLDI